MTGAEIVALVAAVLGSGGLAGILAWWRRGTVLKARAEDERRTLEVRALEAENALAESKRSDRNDLVDQLQEELREHRAAANQRANSQDDRLNRLDHQHDLAREHIHDLRSHIWEGKSPPPPPWPEGLPR